MLIDNTLPTATLSGVATNAKVRGSLSLSASAADTGGSGVQSVAWGYRLGSSGSFLPIGVPDTTVPYGPVSFDTTAVPDGTYQVQALATDGAGNTFADTATNVLIDNTAPTVTLSGVASNAKVRGSLSLSASAADTGGSGVQSVAWGYRLGSSGSFLPIGSPDTTVPYGPVSFDTTGVGDGTYQIQALATDVVGNTLADVATSVLVDNTAPTVTLSGVATNAKVAGSLSLSATAADTGGSGVQSVAWGYRLGSSGSFLPIGVPDTTVPYGPVSFDTTAVPDGTYQVQALATDGAGNTFADTATNVLIDNTAPTVTLSGVASNAKVRGSLSLSASAADTGGSGVQSVAWGYRLGSSGSFLPIGSPDTTVPYGPVSFDTTGVLDGTYQIQALATDVAGNTHADVATNVLVDNTLPTVTIGGVATNDVVRGTLQLSANAATGWLGCGVGPVWAPGVRIARPVHGIGSSLTTEPFNAPFNTTGVADGRYEIQALATDVAGNTRPASALNVLVDNTPPTTPGTPTGLTPVLSLPTISFDPATDTGGSGVNHYDVYRSPGLSPIGTASPAPGGKFTFSDAGAAVGPNIYTVVAVDNAGNASATPSSPVTIYVDPDGRSAPRSVAALATPTNQLPQFSWVAPLQFAVDHYTVTRVGGSATVVPTGTTFIDSTVGDGTYTYQVVAVDSGGAAGTRVDASRHHVRRDAAHRARRRHGHRRRRRLRRHQLAPRATAPARASRATSCGVALLHRACFGRRRRRDLPGHGDLVHRRHRAQRQALQLRGVRRRPRGQHFARPASRRP